MSSRTNPTATSAAYNAKELPSEAHLDAMEEELNQRVDMEVESMRTGMMDLVKLSNITNKDHYAVTLDAFQSNCKTESIIRSAQSLLSLSHTLKLLHLFEDETSLSKQTGQLEQEIADLMNRFP